MSEKEFQSLMDLMKWEAEKVLTKEEALAELISAGILNKDGKYTEPYKDLNFIWPR